MARNHSTVYVGNLSEKVTDDLLYELFLQAGPVASVNIPSDRGKPKSFGFVQFKHPCSVHYAIQMFDGIAMFGKTLRLNLPKGAVPTGMPPMGVPFMPRMNHPKPIIHPLSLQGRLGPPLKSSKNYGHRMDEDNDHEDSRDRNRSRRRDNNMMPSSRPKKNRKDPGEAPEFDIDAIPDLLDSFGPPIPSHGPPKSSHGSSHHEHRRDHPYDNRGRGSHRSHHDSRRERHSHHPANNRRHF